jgi:hypothetical protein
LMFLSTSVREPGCPKPLEAFLISMRDMAAACFSVRWI